MLASVACCLPAGAHCKALLAQNWLAPAADAGGASARPPPAFNPADPQYNELARRLSKCSATRRCRELAAAAAALEKQLHVATGDADKRAKRGELEDAQQQLAEAQAAVAELQASFEQDASSLAPWMCALFALADSGCRLFDAGGMAGPPAGGAPASSAPPLMDLLAPPSAATGGAAALSTWLFRDRERLLGAFQRRYELERGAGAGGPMRVLTRLALATGGEHCGGGAAAAPAPAAARAAAAVEGALDASRLALLGAEGVAAGRLLDGVLLHWGDYEQDLASFQAVLLALARFVAPPGGQQQQEGDGTSALPAPKVAAVGLVDPTPQAITAAVRAGVRLSWVVLPLSLLDMSAWPASRAAAQHGIAVLARDALAHGLLSAAWLGLRRPDTAAAPPAPPAALAGVDSLAAGLDTVDRFGGWARFQGLLGVLQGVAQRQGTSLQVVALAWLLRQGVTPLLPAHWGGGGSGGATTGGSCASAGAPWPASLGLPQFRPEALPLPLPSPAAPQAAKQGGDTPTPPEAVAAPEAAGGGDGAGEGGGAAGATTGASSDDAAAAAGEAPAGEHVSAAKPDAQPRSAAAAPAPVHARWAACLSGLLSEGDVTALVAAGAAQAPSHTRGQRLPTAAAA